MARSPFPSQAELDQLYASSWTDPDVNTAETGSTSGTLTSFYLDRLRDEVGSLTGKEVLDYGAGKGQMAIAMAGSGARVLAYEPYGTATLQASGINAVDSTDLVDGHFDGISAIEVIEHLLDPSEFLAWAWSRTRPGGWLFLTTPNARGLNARLTRSKWREFRKPGHVVLYSPAGLMSLVERAGFSDVQRLEWVYPELTRIKTIQSSVLTPLGLHGALRVLARRND